jgi:hypothetical protein
MNKCGLPGTRPGAQKGVLDEGKVLWKEPIKKRGEIQAKTHKTLKQHFHI